MRIEEAFHEAYTRGLTKRSWRRDEEVYGWLRCTMINWLIDRERRERLELVADTTGESFLEVRTRARNRLECSAAGRSGVR